MVGPSWAIITAFAVLGLAVAGIWALKKSYVCVSPDEFVVHYRNGRIKHLGRGLSFFCLPYDTYLKVPGSLRDINFVADQITKEKQGVRVQGFLAYRIVDFEKAYKNLDLRSNVIRTLPKIEENVNNKDYQGKNREGLVRLDPADPMAKTDEIIRRLAESVVRHEVSNKTLDEMITEREIVIRSMREMMMTTVVEWGLSVDTIEFAEVWIRSKELFQNLQAEYRNAVRLKAQESTSETDQAIVAKQMESEKSIAMMRAGAEREKRVIASQEDLQASETEIQTKLKIAEQETETEQRLALQATENKHRTLMAELANQQTSKQRQLEAQQQLEMLEKESRHRAAMAEQALAHERELRRVANDIEAQAKQHEIEMDRRLKAEAIRRKEAETESMLSQMSERGRIESAELDRQRENVLLQTQIDQKENEARQSAIALEAEVKRIERLAAAQTAKAREEAESIRAIGEAEAAGIHAKIDAQNAVNLEQLQAQLIEKLPEIARSMKVKGVHWVNMAANGESPMGVVPKNMLELLAVFRGFGVDLAGMLQGANGAAKAVPPAVEAPRETPVLDSAEPPAPKRRGGGKPAPTQEA